MLLPKRPCRRCGIATHERNGYCTRHQHLSMGWTLAQQGKTLTERGYGHAWRQVRAAVLLRDRHRCVPCFTQGFITLATAVDHIQPKAQCGTDAMTNLQAICKPCHRIKTQRESSQARHGTKSMGGQKVYTF